MKQKTRGEITFSEEFTLGADLVNACFYPFKNIYICLSRCTNEPQSDVSKYIKVAFFDTNNNVLCSSVLLTDYSGLHDPRLFINSSRISVIAAFWNHTHYSQVCFELKVTSDFKVSIGEKHILEYPAPLKNLIKYNEYYIDFKERSVFDLRMQFLSKMSNNSPFDLRGGSHMVDVKTELVTFCHDWIGAENQRIYRAFLVRMEKQYPFHILNAQMIKSDATASCKIPVEKYVNNHHLKKLSSVIFPISAWKSGDCLFVALGVNDVMTIIQKYKIK